MATPTARDAFRVCESARRALTRGHIDRDAYALIQRSTRELSPAGLAGWGASLTLAMEARYGASFRAVPLARELASLGTVPS